MNSVYCKNKRCTHNILWDKKYICRLDYLHRIKGICPLETQP